jgi:hypothetical protein
MRQYAEDLGIHLLFILPDLPMTCNLSIRMSLRR